MEKINTLKLLQKFMIFFFVSIILTVAQTLVMTFLSGVVMPGIVTFLFGVINFSSYIFIWVSFAKSKDLSTRKAYLWLAILLTVFTIIVNIGVMIAGFIVSSNALSTGLVSITMTQEEMTTILSSLPSFKLINMVSTGVELITNVIYLGLGYFIFTKNKVELAAAEKEHQENYGM